MRSAAVAADRILSFKFIMRSISDFSTGLERAPQTSAFEPPPPTLRSFLIESERKVIGHCLRLLAVADLAAEERQRLNRLVATAETELQRLAA